MIFVDNIYIKIIGKIFFSFFHFDFEGEVPQQQQTIHLFDGSMF